MVKHEKPFTCGGGKEKCDLKCVINRVRIEGKLYMFGGACNRYYNLQHKINVDAGELDFVKTRHDLMYDKYAPVHHADDKALKIGINRALLTHNVFPLYYNFFAGLGCHVIVPDSMNEEALNRQTTSFCYPSQLAIAYFDVLADKNPDYFFMPQLRELFVDKGNDKQDFCATCIFSQGEPYWINAVFKEKKLKEKILDPTINFRKGYASQKKVFVDLAKKLRLNKKKAAESFDRAVRIQEEFEAELKVTGKKALAELRGNPDNFGTILFGRPHNAFSGDANKGIPRKVTTRGHVIIPFEMLDFEGEEMNEPFKETMHWEIGQKLIKASEYVKKDPQLYAIYITNFLCALDSFLVQHVRRIMGTKPSLTLELDGHTADAGINTRIDAFIDVVKNYMQVQKQEKKLEKDEFTPAKVVTEGEEIFYIDSKGKKIPFKDPSVKVLLPSMGDLGTRALASALKKVGVNAVAMDVANDEVRREGRAVLTGKECIPLVVILGSMFRYIKNHKKEGEKLAIFIPKAHGYCRLGQYFITTEMLIKEKKIPDVTPYYFAGEVGYTGLGPEFSLTAWKAIVISDIMDDIRNALYTLAADVGAAVEIFNKEYDKLMKISAGEIKQDLYKALKETAGKFKSIKLKAPFKDTPQIMVNGELFVRRDQWCNNGISKMIAEKGFIPRHASLHEWFFYNNYLIKKGVWKPDHKLRDWIEFYISDAVQLRIERKIKKIMVKSGLYDPEIIDVAEYDSYSEHLISHRLTGEPGLSTGKILKDGLDKYAGHINIGPFGCMITRFTEAVAANSMDVEDKVAAYKQAGKKYDTSKFKPGEKIPFLTIEVDGNLYPQLLIAKFESFCLQAQRAAEKQGKKTAPGTGPESKKIRTAI